MLKIKEAIVVEGRYDKNTLSQILDATIFETNGFGIFKDTQKMDLLRRVAEKRGLIVFTDSDGAGFVIRNRIKSCIPTEHLKHAYIPDVYGKERRKATPGKEGKLGVEGMTREVIYDALRRSGATIEGENAPPTAAITKQDMMELGLSGGKDSGAKRLALLKKLNLPEHMSANALLQALNVLYSLDELRSIITELEIKNMNRYIDEYVLLCGQLCQSADDYTKQNVKRHNQAMSELMQLTEQLRGDMPMAMEVYGELLNHGDLHVKHCAASDCLRFDIYTHQAVKVLKMVCRKGDRMAAMAAKRSLAIWKGKLDPNAPF